MSCPSLPALHEVANRFRTLDEASLVSGLAAGVRRWQSERLETDAGELAAQNGMAVDMVRTGLTRLAGALSADGLGAWLDEAQREAGVGTGAAGPRVVLQILAGNVAGLALYAAVEGLLARSCVILKLATSERVTGYSFKRSLEESAPGLAHGLILETWDGGDEVAERDAAALADVIVVAGEQATLDAVGSRHPGAVIGYGPRFSVGILGAAAGRHPDVWWDAVAREIALWEQRGCLSPRILFVLGEPEGPARRLAGALVRRESMWPAPPPALADAGLIRQARARWDVLDPGDGGILEPGTLSWTVVWDRDTDNDPGPPARFVRLVSVEDLDQVERVVARSADSLQGIGHAGLGEADLRRVASWGVPRVCPLTRIQDPPAGWHADGRSGLAELLRRGRST